ncbi:MAG TPA: IS110 family transposase [Solirubrobacterales bacterium]
MRCIALDVHWDFCEVAIAAQGQLQHTGRIETSKGSLELFAASLGREDQVVLEATGAAFAIARIVKPHVARVVVANAQEVRAISHARVKSDRFDAATLARLLSADLLPEVWVCDERIGALRRRLARRGALVRQRTRAKNEVHAVIARCLLGRAPASDLFGKGGRAWLERQELPEEERETVEGCLRQIDFLDSEVELIDRKVAGFVLGSADALRLMTVPGVDVITAAALVAAIGDITRFASPRKLVAYLGLDPRVRQSGSEPARHGRISKRGDARARFVLVEAAWTATRTPGPLRAFGERIRVRRGKQVAAVAVARKIATIAWQMLSKGEDFAFARPSLTRTKLRRLERLAGAPAGTLVDKRPQRRLVDRERELQEQAERGYRRLVEDWRVTKKGAGATPGRASQRPSKGMAARQSSKPQATAL